MEVSNLDKWPNMTSRPYVIAGPCSAESELQIIETGRKLKEDGRVSAFRAGLWKPRTRPGGFQGLGDVALPWLTRIQNEIGLPVITEVARPQHVYATLKAGIKMMWIGARTSVNPFLVQELADAMRGCNVSVLVKNPVSPDLPLWIGALERFSQVGLKNVGAIHRGFSKYETGFYRNPPEWNIAIEFRKRLPDTMLLCDPSHITGNAEMVPYVAQTSMDLGYDGLMVEVHPDPENALSDASQQIKPSVLSFLLDNLILRNQRPIRLEASADLEVLRNSIDQLDKIVVDTLSNRFVLVNQIANLKLKEGIMVLQMERWQKLLEARMDQARLLNLDPNFIRSIFELIHIQSIKQQEEIINKLLLSHLD